MPPSFWESPISRKAYLSNNEYWIEEMEESRMDQLPQSMMSSGPYSKSSLLTYGIILSIIGSILLIISIILSYMFSNLGVTDGPNHAHVLWFILLPGLKLTIIGAALMLLTERRRINYGNVKSARYKAAVALFITVFMLSVFFLNPFLSPIPFFNDTDLDGIPNFSDDFPYAASRQDFPWISFGGRGDLSASQDNWMITISWGFADCWTDYTYVRVLGWDNSSVLGRTSLNSLNGGNSQNGVFYNDENNNGMLDEGDTFLLDRTIFPNGYRMTIFGYDEVQYYFLAWFSAHQ